MIALAGSLRSRTVAALTSPHGVDHYLSQIVNPMWAAHEVRGRVVAMHRETDTIGAPVATLTLQPTATWRGHRAGQYVQVGLDLPGSARRMTRCFSISSAASARGRRSRSPSAPTPRARSASTSSTPSPASCST